MDKNIKFELNRAGVRELLQSSAMMEIVEGKARTALSRLGDGYTMSTYVGRNRVNAEVATASPEARRENLKNNTILKAVGAAR